MVIRILLVLSLVCGTSYATLMSKKKEVFIESNLPTFSEEWVNNIVYNPRTIWYTEAEVPEAFQKAVGS
jgi:hypothetical protein